MMIDPLDDPECEDYVVALANASLRSPAIGAELRELATAARQLLEQAEHLGFIKLVRDADGHLSAEILNRVLH
jgi:hypothetical protein